MIATHLYWGCYSHFLSPKPPSFGVGKLHQENRLTRGIVHEAPPHLADLHPKCLEHFTGFQMFYQMLYKRMNWTKTTSAICDDPPYLFICLQTNQHPELEHLFCWDTRVKLNPPDLGKAVQMASVLIQEPDHVDNAMSVFGIWVFPKIVLPPNHPF